MSRNLPGGDTLPWYRQFWPWFLIILPGSVVVASLSTLYIANRHADDLVVDEYYKDGLAINRELEKKQRADELGIDARLSFEAQSVLVTTTGPVGDTDLELRLSHPLEADRDFTVKLIRLSPGSYSGPLSERIMPRWHWILQQTNATGWRLDGAVQAADIGDVPRG